MVSSGIYHGIYYCSVNLLQVNEKRLEKKMNVLDNITLSELELETVVGGDDCFFGDIGCILWGTIKSVGGMIGNSPTPPPTCIPKSASNPAPPVPCP
ncbi:hypothetical protein ACYKL6_06605 [Streptococcus suis]